MFLHAHLRLYENNLAVNQSNLLIERLLFSGCTQRGRRGSSSIILASSIVWNYFTKIDNGSNAQCNDCELKLAIADGYASSLRRHLQQRHSIENLCKEVISRQQHHQPVSGDSSSNNNDKLSDGQPTLKQFVKANQSLEIKTLISILRSVSLLLRRFLVTYNHSV